MTDQRGDSSVLNRAATIGPTKGAPGASSMPAAGTDTDPPISQPLRPPSTSNVVPLPASKRRPAARVSEVSVTSPEAGTPGGTSPSRDEDVYVKSPRSTRSPRRARPVTNKAASRSSSTSPRDASNSRVGAPVKGVNSPPTPAPQP